MVVESWLPHLQPLNEPDISHSVLDTERRVARLACEQSRRIHNVAITSATNRNAKAQGREGVKEIALRPGDSASNCLLYPLTGQSVLGNPVGLASQVCDVESNSNSDRESAPS
jgi:hypothetical protein